jgi:hypothetical protein
LKVWADDAEPAGVFGCRNQEQRLRITWQPPNPPEEGVLNTVGKRKGMRKRDRPPEFGRSEGSSQLTQRKWVATGRSHQVPAHGWSHIHISTHHHRGEVQRTRGVAYSGDDAVGPLECDSTYSGLEGDAGDVGDVACN